MAKQKTLPGKSYQGSIRSVAGQVSVSHLSSVDGLMG